jgi:hypothetical protein
MRLDFEEKVQLGCSFAGIFLVLSSIAAWITHVAWIIGALTSANGATSGQMILGAIGALVPPVGVIHGVMIWFGAGV